MNKFTCWSLLQINGNRKRASKKAAARKKRASSPRSASRKKASGGFSGFIRRCCFAALLLALALGAVYYFSSYSVRGKMEQSASSVLNSLRSSLPWPGFIEAGFNAVYDAVPHSEGLIVDSCELGHDGSPLLAGVPTAKRPIRVLNNKTNVNVFSPDRGSSLCLAYYLSGEGRQRASAATQAYDDPRVPQLRASQLSSGAWIASPLAPPQFLAAEFGQTACNEAMLSTQLSPMSAAFASGPWQELAQELYHNYPRRFGEVWVYSGPVYTANSPTLPAKLSVPTHFYAIAFDLTEAGGLRAIAFMLPNHASDRRLERYICSIGEIESVTGLNLMPEMAFDARETLLKWVSPQLW